MKIFFIGNVKFSSELLKSILRVDFIEIVGVATKSKSDFNSDHYDLSKLIEKENIPYKYVKDINAPHIVEWIKSLAPDYIFCFGWSSLLKEKVLQITPNRVIGYHPAKIPENRGRHPLIWALVLGLKETGSTFFIMDQSADTGDIISQEAVKIDKSDTALTLYNKIIETAITQIHELLPKMVSNSIVLKKQPLSKGNEWRKRSRNDGLIDFRMNSQSIYNLVRALTKPYPGAEIQFAHERYQIWESRIGKCNFLNIEPGKVLRISDNEIEVKTSDSSIILVDHTLDQLPKEGDYLI
ncbi:hypothetical protein JKA74_05650 [Marivirga sp. S37H4]|uniref:Methionyl-tRNA formyltransferase n=1 Tax=Marivirga aurantiaca TaxID=2802615 RepID=A0A934WXA1_9BACT|nr:formyltransferase family protein [Marivirga aurantiaca]MBK6264515.1 hypothetical protein [Marivirga aurantiaca]